MMKNLRYGHMHHVPISVTRPRRIKRHQSLFVFKAVLIVAILTGLVLSAVMTLQMDNSQQAVALGSSALPDSNRIDASGAESVFEDSIIDPRLILGTELPVIYGLDLDEVETGETEHEEQPSQQGTDIFFDVLPDDIKMEILDFANDAPKNFHIGTTGPQVLIYHTHTLEAYRQIEGQEYVEAGAWRTNDFDSSVIAVGEVLKAQLESYGYTVLHDTTNHEPPSLKTAYSRSLETMERYAKEYPTLRLFIDLHRDAYNDVEAGKKDFVTVDGNECARMMFVVGTGEKYSIKPNYESNYKLALAVTNELESICKGFTRPIRVKTGRYNQQVSDMCLLIEVGHNANALEQAKNAAKYAALAISKVVAIGE